MPRKPRPWFREERNAWFVKLDGKYVWLGEHPEGAAKPKKNARGLWNVPTVVDDEFHRIMASPSHVRSGTVWEVFDAFLGWTQSNRAPRTYEWYQERLQRFKDAQPNLAVERLTPDHVYQWLNDKTWSDTYKRGCMTALCRAFNWAVNARKIVFSPLKGIEKPEAASRDQVLSEAQFRVILGHIKDEPFRDLIKTVWLTGCRPQEVASVEADQVFDGFWKFPVKKSKGKKRQRVVFLVPEAQRISEKWAKRFPEGPIFRNNRGRPWTAMAFNNRFLRLKEKIGFKVCMYAIRHSYAHNGLTKGKIDPVVMATLLGHSGTTMIFKTYGHLLHDPDFMREAALRATSGASVGQKTAAKPRGAGAGRTQGTSGRRPR